MKKCSIFGKSSIFNTLKINQIPNLVRYPLAFFQKHKNDGFCLLNFDRFSPFNSKLKSCRKSKNIFLLYTYNIQNQSIKSLIITVLYTKLIYIIL